MHFTAIAVALIGSAHSFRRIGQHAQECPGYELGSPMLRSGENRIPFCKDDYRNFLAGLDVEKLYYTIVDLMKNSQDCWPADGPQDDDVESYAGLFMRLAWHCSGTLKRTGTKVRGGCEGGNLRHWPEREWRDNGGLDHARALVAQVKAMPEYNGISWGDLMTFAGTVAVKASGGPVKKFCFGRIDDEDGSASLMLGTEGTTECEFGDERCTSHVCTNTFQWPTQEKTDHVLCNSTQADGREQASHSVGLIYVYPEGPQVTEADEFFGTYGNDAVHQRSPYLSAMEVRDTFTRMGWNDSETVALIAGGHSLGRTHGNCAAAPSGTPCNGKYTTTSGFEGAWTRTPSKWSYDYFEGMFEYWNDWEPTQSPEEKDQWGLMEGKGGDFEGTMRLTADIALLWDKEYYAFSRQFYEDPARFDDAFQKSWFTLTHRSAAHPGDDDLENDAGKCTTFDFVVPSTEPPH